MGRGKPLAIDLFCGLGGWTEGLLAEGYQVIGFDIEAHEYDGERYPAQLVLQDVLTLHGSQFRNADLIVASPPCQQYSYMAMPWSRAKAKAGAIRADTTGEALKRLNALFDACFRIQREACEAAGRHIPMVVENVKGAQPWVGRARFNYGSYYLWGDTPALMPAPSSARKNGGGSWFNIGSPGQQVTGSNPVHWPDDHMAGLKAPGGGHIRDGNVKSTFRLTNPAEGRKNSGDWFGSGENCSLQRRAGSKSSARKAASARIAKIPLTLSQHIARHYLPATESEAA